MFDYLFGEVPVGLISWGIKLAITSSLRRYGKVLDLRLDSKTKKIEVSLLLDGEKERIEVFVGKYQIIESAGVSYFQAADVQVSRKWMNVLASEFIDGRNFPLPDGFAMKIAKMVL